MRTLLIVAAVLTHLVSAVSAADVTQFRGADRMGAYPDVGLLKSWPAGGPPVAWVADGLGKGFSSPVVVDDTIYLPGTLGESDGYIFMLDLDGQVKGKIAYGKETLDSRAPGSRSTPTLDGKRMYMLSGLGVVTCHTVPDGKLLWQRNVLEAFGGKNIRWSLAESVLVDGDRVICTPGGPDASVVALDKMTGATVWTSKGLSDGASYCSPDIIEHRGRRILVTETAKLVVGLDAETGELLWTHDHPTDYDIHQVTPIYGDGLLYYSGGYGSGGGALALSDDGSSVTPVWTDETLDCQHHGVVLVDGYLYGTGHQSRQGLTCLEMATGKLMWTTREVSQGVVVYADGMLYVYEGPKEGVMNLVKASPDSLQRTGTFEVTLGSKEHWAHQVIAGKRLYVRHGDVLIAYDIAAN